MSDHADFNPATRPSLQQLTEIADAIRTGRAFVDDATSEDKQRVLHERAQRIANDTHAEDEGRFDISAVAFRLADELYAIESAFVHEVYPSDGLTPVPCTPPFVAGVMNFRGKIISVLDLKQIFGLPADSRPETAFVLLLASDEMEFGILADSIHGLVEISFADLHAALPTMKGIREEYLRGITADRMVLLDAAKMLHDRKLIINEHIASERQGLP